MRKEYQYIVTYMATIVSITASFMDAIKLPTKDCSHGPKPDFYQKFLLQ